MEKDYFRQEDIKKKVRYYFNARTHYDNSSLIRKILHKRREEIINKLIGEGNSILDVGCGRGEILSKAKYNKKVGIDISPNMLKNIKDTSILAIQGDAYDLPFKDKSFNTLVSVAVLEYLPNPEDIIKEFFRVLKDNGILIITFPYRYTFVLPLRWYYKYLTDKPEIINTVTRSDIPDLLEGFQILKIKSLFGINYLIKCRKKCQKKK